MMISKWLLRSVLIIIILAMLLISFLLTPYGFKFTFYVLDKTIPAISYKSANGVLTGPITLKAFDYQKNGTHIHINDLTFDWSPLALLKHKLEIKALTADGITVILPKHIKENFEKNNTEKKSLEALLTDFTKNLKPFQPKPLQLPISVQINNAYIHDIKIGHTENNFSTVIQAIHINGYVYANHMNLIAAIALSKPHPVLALLKIKGSLKHYVIHLTAKDRFAHVTLNAEGNKNNILIHMPKGSALNGNMQGTVQLSWYPMISWNAHLNTVNMNLNSFDPVLPKSITLSLLSQGTLENNMPYFDLTADAIVGKANAHIKANHDKTWHAKWIIHIPDLHDFSSKASGSIDTQGSLEGQLRLPQTLGTITGKNIRYDDIQTNNITGKWHVYADMTHASMLDFIVNKIDYKTEHLNVAHLQVTGLSLKKNLLATLDLNQHAVTLTTQAQYDGVTLRGKILQLHSQHSLLGNWSLKNPTQFQYGPEKADLKPLCLVKDTGAFLCLQGDWQRNHLWHMSLKTNKFNFTDFQKNVPGNTQFTSKISMNMNATGTGKNIENAQADIAIDPGTLTYIASHQAININVRKSNIHVLINKKIGLTANLNLNLATQDMLKGNIDIPNFNDEKIPFKEKKLSSHLNLIIHDFSFIRLFQRVIKVSFGQLTGQFTLAGTVNAPKFTGDADIKIPEFEYLPVMAHAQNISAHIHADGKKLSYTATGYAFNKAPILFKGETDLAAPEITTRFTITAQNAEAIKNNQMDVFANASLNFLINHDAFNIDGDIFATKANITPVDLSNTLEMPKNNVVYIGLPETEKTKSAEKINLNLKIALGNDINFKAYGITAKVAGGILLKISPEQATVANGQIHITKGTFEAYGQYLVLDKGSSISYVESPINNPFINARAYKYINATTVGAGTQLTENNMIVGVLIQGTLHHMKFDLYSQPAGMPQADILSYLVLGYGSNNANAANLSVLLDATNAMINSGRGLDQPVSFTDRIKQALGIKELGVRNETLLDALGNPIQDQSSFVVGEQLGKNIYLEYRRGMGVPDNIFTVQYRFKKHWILQTTSGSGGSVGTGADILYKIETN
jgi:translocation and assembly module TamB